ncbi:Glycosyltransferase Family 4 [Bryocella elongata]|uniref:Glycosyltransferase Family 4 n=1 Tax=Bryocella elongata TaxID=863522 RepID=A0A1H5XYV3_9BACT|nr:glycosyltransferase family 4 protein [Bryocella elongata]SEG17009.1 Glycosyltransferase Family 4 [Bryocella elongata]
MKILWASPFFLHPTDRGAQIRSLGTLRELHKRHEIHFAALNDPANTEGPERAGEYSTTQTVVSHVAPKRGSLGMVPQLVASLWEQVPLAVSRYASERLRSVIAAKMASEHFDSIVCDFLACAPNMPDLSRTVLFEHNVEATIWQRHASQAGNPLKQWFFTQQAQRMEMYERNVCRSSRAVIAVSDLDARRMQQIFGVSNVASVPTGVDLDYFRQPVTSPKRQGLVFVGSMDWLPNIDAVRFFLGQVFPLILAQRPGTTFTIAGREPTAEIRELAAAVPGVTVTGTVPDIRPYLWESAVSVVPIRIGGGTRLKIYECMAAGLPTVSTTVGAEGLTYNDGKDILIADEPAKFAAACLRLLEQREAAMETAANALELVEQSFSWSAIGRVFEAILERNRLEA